jgi:TetR/AcrR family transcriptional regulator, fatty acid metabolism regulator protein
VSLRAWATTRRAWPTSPREAGIAYGLVYHYFRNKEEVLSTIFEERWSAFLGSVEAIAAASVPVRDKLVAIAALVLGAYRVRPTG